MTGTGTQSARQFLDAVDAACGDLAPADRQRLLGGLEEHLAELSAEGVDLVAELGDPVAYAAELRSAAGLPTAGLPAVVAAGSGAGPRADSGQPGRSGPAEQPAGPTYGPAGTAHDGPPHAAYPPYQGHPTGPSGPSAGKVLLVIGAVLAGMAVLVVAALLFGGLLLFSSSSTGGATPVATEQVTVAVPDVTAMTQDQARQLIEQAGLALGTVSRTASAEVPVDHVASQDPAAGAAVSPGATVDLVVSAGP